MNNFEIKILLNISPHPKRVATLPFKNCTKWSRTMANQVHMN